MGSAMKFKFNMQSALVSCFVAVFLSVAINQDDKDMNARCATKKTEGDGCSFLWL